MAIDAIIARQMDTLIAMGLKPEAYTATEAAIGSALGAGQFGNIDLSAASKPANAFTEQYGAGPVALTVPVRQASTGRF